MKSHFATATAPCLLLHCNLLDLPLRRTCEPNLFSCLWQMPTPTLSAGPDSIGDWRGWHGFVGDRSRSKAEEPCNTCFKRHDNYGTPRFLTCAFISPCVMDHPLSLSLFLVGMEPTRLILLSSLHLLALLADSWFCDAEAQRPVSSGGSGRSRGFGLVLGGALIFNGSETCKDESQDSQ